jgi:ADP-ribose pyrophosphatase
MTDRERRPTVMAPEIVYRGRKIQVAVDTLTAADGRTITRDVVVHPGAVAILPLLDDEHVVLLRNERFIVGETLWELPAGTLEPGEPPDQAAPRELAEETGYSAVRWRHLLTFYPSPGILSERTHLYLARDLTPGPMSLEPGEHLTPQTITWRDALAWALDGTIRDAKTLVGILLWERLRTRA